jgi:hypothetical protein
MRMPFVGNPRLNSSPGGSDQDRADGTPFMTIGQAYDNGARIGLSSRPAGFQAKMRFYEIGSFAGLAETDGLLRGRS